MVYSFDIFDTCLVRKCGTPENMLDVLSLRVFKEPVDERVRQEFVAARYIADKNCGSNPFATIYDIYNNLSWSHSMLRSINELIEEELSCERMLLTPVSKIKEQINKLRSQGHHIIYISDMYLPDTFLRDILKEQGLLQKEDSLYVSCVIGKRKSDGSLYEYIKKVENLHYSRWHHYGDNKQSDVLIPRHYGIKTHLIMHKYTPYQEMWKRNDYSIQAKVGSMLAGIGRSLHLSLSENRHRDFVLDIIAPFYASSVYRLMADAYKVGIQRLYFCARDAYFLFLVAQRYKPLFDDLDVEYLYISQKALYDGDEETRIAYYKQIGLASQTQRVAIVDVRSSGHTAESLNRQLIKYGYKEVRAYYFEMFCCGDMTYIPTNYYSEINKLYVVQNSLCSRLVSFWQLYEMFFCIHNQERTLGYEKIRDYIQPIFDKGNQSDKDEKERGNGYVNDSQRWGDIHRQILLKYVDDFIELRLYRYADECFEKYVIPTLIQFMDIPNSYYLTALEDFIVFDGALDYNYKPYVRKESWIEILKTKGRDTYWKRGTLILSLPKWLVKLYHFKRYLNAIV